MAPNACKHVFRILRTHTSRMGRFSYVVRVISVGHFVKYPTYLVAIPKIRHFNHPNSKLILPYTRLGLIKRAPL